MKLLMDRPFRTRMAVRLIVGATLAFLAVNLLLLPREPALGYDFLVFLGAAITLRSGHDPYDAEQRAATFHHLPLLTRPHEHVPSEVFANPPFAAWATIPFTAIPAPWAFALWTLLLFGATLVSGRLMQEIDSARRPGARSRIAVALLAVCPIAVTNYYLGQLVPLLLLCVTTALFLLDSPLKLGRRMERRIFVAGCMLALACLKPHLLLPPIMVFIAAQPRSYLRTLLAGFVVASMLLLAVPAAILGPWIMRSWLHGMLAFGQTFGVQPAVLSLSQIYRAHLSPMQSVTLSVMLIALWCAAMTLLVRRTRYGTGSDRARSVFAVALTSWLIIIPYVHPADLLLLVAVVPALGYTGQRWKLSWSSGVAIATFVLVPEMDLLRGLGHVLIATWSLAVPVAVLVFLRPDRLLARSRRTDSPLEDVESISALHAS